MTWIGDNGKNDFVGFASFAEGVIATIPTKLPSLKFTLGLGIVGAFAAVAAGTLTTSAT